MQRRNFVRALIAGATSTLVGCQAQPTRTSGARFDHGVASGDPLADRVILWTRVSGVGGETVDVGWQVASDPDMRRSVRSGVYTTGPYRDYTVKVDADGLEPGRTLYYQFTVDGVRSPVGRTRTLPTGTVRRAVFAVVSCSNHPAGYFHVYREIADRDDIDAVLHLGDYIYEYGLGGYATERAEALGRIPEPRTELLSLADYRLRHAQYKADPDSQAMHAAHPLIAAWDDHEIANDAWMHGAENHAAGEGAWEARRDAAIQAWLEWMPVRAAHRRGRTRTFRDYRYGDLASLIMLDTRLYGRDRQPDAGRDVTPESVRAALADPARRMLGEAQEHWFANALAGAAGSTWQVIGQQVMVSPTRSPSLGPLLDLERDALVPRADLERYIVQSESNPPMLFDTWNGYPVAREEFLATLARFGTNPVVLSGDLHTSLAGNLVPAGGTEPVSVEFLATSVSSPGFAEYLPERRPGAVRDATLELNPALRYMETDRRGWLRIELDPEHCTGEWHLVDTVHRRAYSSHIDARLAVRAGEIARGLLPA